MDRWNKTQSEGMENYWNIRKKIKWEKLLNYIVMVLADPTKKRFDEKLNSCINYYVEIILVSQWKCTLSFLIVWLALWVGVWYSSGEQVWVGEQWTTYFLVLPLNVVPLPKNAIILIIESINYL